MKWKRIRPGLYNLRSNKGELLAFVERGGETGRWWWKAWPSAIVEIPGPSKCGYRETLAFAKREAERAFPR